MAELLAEKLFTTIVGGWWTRESAGRMPVAEFSALAEIGVKRMTHDAIATRGESLILTRSWAAGRDPRADAFSTDLLNIVEIDADEQIVAHIKFDPDDIDAAFAELDARYLAGEAAAPRTYGRPSLEV